jgi:beta-N-acetylhexosaminidase
MVDRSTHPRDLFPFGNHLIVGLSGTFLSDEDKKVLESLRPVGVLLLARNFVYGKPYGDWIDSLDTLLAEVKRYAGRSQMLVTLDHEGGTVVRTPHPITRFPPPCLLREQSYNVARATGRELCSLGVNVSWAPLADINSNPNNPIIGVRALSSDPVEVATFARAYARGLSDAGVIGCAKHFPGHGDTSTDSHLELPVLPTSREVLLQRELVPFRALCGDGIPLVMTAHVLFPAVDPSEPATFSRTLIHDLLRGELGYDGVVVSDDLEMRAISRRIDEEGAVVEPFIAGCDLTIVARYLSPRIDHLFSMAHVFSERVEEDANFADQISRARRRIDSLLIKTPMPAVEVLAPEVLENHARLSIEVAFGR